MAFIVFKDSRVFQSAGGEIHSGPSDVVDVSPVPPPASYIPPEIRHFDAAIWEAPGRDMLGRGLGSDCFFTPCRRRFLKHAPQLDK